MLRATTMVSGVRWPDRGEAIADIAAGIHAATYQLLVLLREFDERLGWKLNVGYAIDVLRPQPPGWD